MAEDLHTQFCDEIMSQDSGDLANHGVIIVVDLSQVPLELQDGVASLIDYAPDKNLVSSETMQDSNSEFRWYIRFVQDATMQSGELAVKSRCANYKETLPEKRFEIDIQYNRKIEAFRAIGQLLGVAKEPSVMAGEDWSLVNFSSQSQFDTQGVLIDCSRNGVLRLKSVYTILCIMSLMGLNMLQLYTEDTYEVDGEPLFGYMRGKYTQEELSSIDDYAYDLGIEVVPCIQTLGHMGQVLQWPQYAHLRDNSEVLLAEHEGTYDFIEKLIKAAKKPFRSNRIHLGMDEAYGVGEGRYRQIFGYKDSTNIFVEHLQRVNEICGRLHLQPMIWSDMLFCLAAKNNALHGYYDENNNPATPELVSSMPDNVELIFWDYYHTSEDIYAQKLSQHRDLGCQQPWIATSAWTWSRFWTALPFSFESIRASTVTAKKKSDGVRNSFITIWGDEGNESDIFSSLPALHYYAEHCYSEHAEVDVPILKRNFEAICGGTFDDWVYASKIDENPAGVDIGPQTHYAPNMSKWLLWEDPFLGFLSPQYADENLSQHYDAIATRLFNVLGSAQGPVHNCRLELPARVARVLSLKCHLQQLCAEKYRNDQSDELYKLVQERLKPLCEEVDQLWRYHRKLWMTMYKPFGWEVLELRYGGLRTRLATMYDRIMAYLDYKSKQRENGHVDGEEDEVNGSIPEFETDLQCLFFGSRTNLLLDYARVVSPSRPG